MLVHNSSFVNTKNKHFEIKKGPFYKILKFFVFLKKILKKLKITSYDSIQSHLDRT